MRVLIADDDPTSRLILEAALVREGHEVVVCADGLEALTQYEASPFDLVVTDWMMPSLDGASLLRRIRAVRKPGPLALVVTALTSDAARRHATSAGADAYLTKPIEIPALLDAVRALIAVRDSAPDSDGGGALLPVDKLPPHPITVIGAGTGGPEVLVPLLRGMARFSSPIVVVQQGPAWLLEAFAESLASACSMRVTVGTHGHRLKTSEIVVAASNSHHLLLGLDGVVELSDGPAVRHARPAVDPLFLSAARVYGRFTTALVLTGLGSDGANGVSAIVERGGTALAQEPSESLVPDMPRFSVNRGARPVALLALASTLRDEALRAATQLDEAVRAG